jgi:hypothetical protein
VPAARSHISRGNCKAEFAGWQAAANRFPMTAAKRCLKASRGSKSHARRHLLAAAVHRDEREIIART